MSRYRTEYRKKDYSNNRLAYQMYQDIIRISGLENRASVRIWQRRYRTKNKEKIAKNGKLYRQKIGALAFSLHHLLLKLAFPEEFKMRQRKNYCLNKETYKRRSLAWRKKNRARYLAKCRQWNTKNKEKLRVLHKQWVLKNQTKVRKYKNKWQKRNRPLISIQRYKRKYGEFWQAMRLSNHLKRKLKELDHQNKPVIQKEKKDARTRTKPAHRYGNNPRDSRRAVA